MPFRAPIARTVRTRQGTSDHNCTMRWRFGRFELDTARAELRSEGVVVDIEPQVFDVLRTLIEHRDRVVSHRELLDAVWGERIVGPTTVASRIKAARRAVGDDGRHQRVIATAHGVGYRFVAELDPSPSSDVPPRPGARSEEPVRPRARAELVGRQALIDELVGAYADGAPGVALVGHPASELDAVAGAAASAIGDRHGASVERTVPGLDHVALGAVAHLLTSDVTVPSADPRLDRARLLRRAVDDLDARWSSPPAPVLVVGERARLDPLSRALVDAVVRGHLAFVLEVAGSNPPASGLLARSVPRLADADVRAIAETLLGGPIAPGLAADLAAACDGSAVRAQEIVTSSLAAGALVRRSGVWTATAELVSPTSPRWPPDGLGAGAVRVAELLALAGSLPIGVVRAIADQRSLDELDVRRMISVGTDDGTERVRLVSPLLRSAIEARLPPLRRARLVSQLASARAGQD